MGHSHFVLGWAELGLMWVSWAQGQREGSVQDGPPGRPETAGAGGTRGRHVRPSHCAFLLPWSSPFLDTGQTRSRRSGRRRTTRWPCSDSSPRSDSGPSRREDIVFTCDCIYLHLLRRPELGTQHYELTLPSHSADALDRGSLPPAGQESRRASSLGACYLFDVTTMLYLCYRQH